MVPLRERNDSHEDDDNGHEQEKCQHSLPNDIANNDTKDATITNLPLVIVTNDSTTTNETNSQPELTPTSPPPSPFLTIPENEEMHHFYLE